MTKNELNQVNDTVKKLNATGKVIVDCRKKLVTAIKGEMSLRISGMVDHLKKYGCKLKLVDELPGQTAAVNAYVSYVP